MLYSTEDWSESSAVTNKDCTFKNICRTVAMAGYVCVYLSSHSFAIFGNTFEGSEAHFIHFHFMFVQLSIVWSIDFLCSSLFAVCRKQYVYGNVFCMPKPFVAHCSSIIWHLYYSVFFIVFTKPLTSFFIRWLCLRFAINFVFFMKLLLFSFSLFPFLCTFIEFRAQDYIMSYFYGFGEGRISIIAIDIIQCTRLMRLNCQRLFEFSFLRFNRIKSVFYLFYYYVEDFRMFLSLIAAGANWAIWKCQ